MTTASPWRGTILLGLDHHTEDYIRRFIDFLLEIELDLAEFTILAPFPHTRAFDELHAQGRILSYDWDDYTADRVVYQPKHMPPEKLQALFDYAWEVFYREESQRIKMYRLYQRVIQREVADGTFRPRKREMAGRVFGRDLVRG